jgi:hypothetical protein
MSQPSKMPGVANCAVFECGRTLCPRPCLCFRVITLNRFSRLRGGHFSLRAGGGRLAPDTAPDDYLGRLADGRSRNSYPRASAFERCASASDTVLSINLVLDQLLVFPAWRFRFFAPLIKRVQKETVTDDQGRDVPTKHLIDNGIAERKDLPSNRK